MYILIDLTDLPCLGVYGKLVGSRVNQINQYIHHIPYNVTSS